MPRLSSVICLSLSLFVTFFVLAPWFTEQILNYQLVHRWDITMLFATGLVVVFIALFVAGIGSEPFWSKRQGIVGLAAIIAWLAGVQLAFIEHVEPLFARSSQALAFGICSVWLPVMAWSTFWPMPWSTRAVLVGVLMLSQPVFPAIYSVGSKSERDRFIVLRRNQSYSAIVASRDKPNASSGPSPLSGESTGPLAFVTVPAPNSAFWTIQNYEGASAKLETTSSPTTLSVAIDSLGRNKKAWEIQLTCPGLQIKQGTPFAINFRAKAAKPRRLGVSVTRNYSPWENLKFYQSIELGTDWQDYRYVIASPDSDEGRARLVFEAGEDLTSFELDQLEISPPVAPLAEPTVAQVPPQNPLSTPVETTPSQGSKPVTRSLPASSVTEDPGEFDLEQWTFVCDAGGFVAANVQRGVLSLTLTDGNVAEAFKVRLENRQYSLAVDKEYVFRFRARSSSPRSIELASTQPNPPYPNMGLFQRIELTPEWKDFEFKFKPSITGPCWLHFNLNGPGAKLEIARATLVSP